ncbi:MAG: polysaccharide pyruvyl transferase family protein, partial [Flavobacteriales bacterium]|nr:polysaccharide pyruvyl transferase family protein [Flavobacteriales bacterium]
MIRIIHFGIHKIENKNSGDTVLFKLTQKLFNKFQNNIEWTNKNLWEPIDEDDINKINTNFDFILIGGGGLLLIDQKGAENSKSGWQFNCSTPLIKKISIPVIVFGIGYNRFRRQSDFPNIFKDNINALVEKSIFFGLRNNGSIKKLKEYLTSENSKKISLQHCPTVILDLIENVKTKPSNIIEKISINFAYDRPKNRFLDEIKILNHTSQFIKYLVERNYKIDICLHKEDDIIIINYINDNNLKEKINIV